ncbi:MAG TPA: STAS/SEC14 domain-containing protein [Gaiellaceae bacterium]|nr:STAS/SEC14 domain-containing protein [Gaiellaceae bacterium]
MEYRIDWNGGAEDVLLTTSGDADVDALDAMVEELLVDPRFREGLKILLDHRKCRWIALETKDVCRRAELQQSKRDRIGYQQIAFVVDAPEEYGMARMLGAFLDGQVRFVAHAFTSIDEARAWLTATPTGPVNVAP